MTSFTMTLDAADFPRASELFTRLAIAFAMFRDTVSAPAVRAAAPAAAPAQSEPVADAEPAAVPAEAPKRRGRPPKAVEPTPTPAAPTPAPKVAQVPDEIAEPVHDFDGPAEPADEFAGMSDNDVLNALRAAGNAVVTKIGAQPVAAALAEHGVKQYSPLNREQRIALIGKFRALLANA